MQFQDSCLASRYLFKNTSKTIHMRYAALNQVKLLNKANIPKWSGTP